VQTVNNATVDRSFSRFAQSVVVIVGLGSLILGPIATGVNLGIEWTFRYRNRVHPVDKYWETYAGRAAFPIAWEVFFVGVLLCAVVVVACWSPARWPRERLIKGSTVQIPLPLQVAAVAAFAGIASYSAGRMYTPLGQASWYGVPLLFGGIVVLLCLIWYRKTLTTEWSITSTRNTRPKAPSRFDRVAHAVLFAVVATTGLGGVVVILFDVVALWAGGHTPVRTNLYIPHSAAYRGAMPFVTPWWVFVVLDLVIVVIAMVPRLAGMGKAPSITSDPVRLSGSVAIAAISVVFACLMLVGFVPKADESVFLMTLAISTAVFLVPQAVTLASAALGIKKLGARGRKQKATRAA
jgi:hypothetical protein